jgi:L-arabinose isomerase
MGRVGQMKVIGAAVELVKAKLRWKGKPGARQYSESWTKAEIALYEAVKNAGLLPE